MIGGGCISDGKYNMTADLYSKGAVRDENTGQVKAVYTLTTPGFALIARGLANLRGKDSGTIQDYGNKLEEYHYLRVKTMQVMDEGDVLIRLRDAGGNFYKDIEQQFVVLGVTPTYDPFGMFVEYDIICNEADVPVKIVDAVVASAGDSGTLVGGE